MRDVSKRKDESFGFFLFVLVVLTALFFIKQSHGRSWNRLTLNKTVPHAPVVQATT